ncbi:hypothetical protein K1719_028895 [Acacia pycnantha]|nr:hypothetical protein K1719_028895 [Acacia pycnantha]
MVSLSRILGTMMHQLGDTVHITTLLVPMGRLYAVEDWAYKIDPLRCISMDGITKHYLSGQKADATGFVCLLLGDLV